MVITRPPSPRLRPFVRLLWAADPAGAPRSRAAARERVLPTGEMHVVFRLTDHPLRLYEGVDDIAGRTISHSIVGGVAASSYLRAISMRCGSVGAQLHPGACDLLFGVPPAELLGCHLPLEDLWGSSAAQARDRLLHEGSLVEKMMILESLLAARLPEVCGLHPAVAHALQRFGSAASVGQVVREAGWSHRQFIALFSRAMGMTPKLYSRLLRFQGAVRRLAQIPTAPAADVALDAGYSDQPHFSREFLEFAGITPGEYRALSPARTHHVPVRPAAPDRERVKFVQDGRIGSG